MHAEKYNCEKCKRVYKERKYLFEIIKEYIINKV